MKRLLYPKIYATIIARDNENFTIRVVLDGSGEEKILQLENRNGRGHYHEFVPGLRVKIYTRPGDSRLFFRKVGS